MNKSFSQKITHINFILTIMILLLHSNMIRFVPNASHTIINTYNFIFTLVDSAVPLFFVISSFLFYRNFSNDKIKIKIKSRMKTLFIPYAFFSIFFLIYYTVLMQIPFVGKYFDCNFDLRISNIIPNIIFANCAEGMWFVRTLLVFSLLSPLIYFLLNNKKIFMILAIIVLYFINFIFNIRYSNFLFWFPLYLISAFISYHYSNIIENAKYEFNFIIYSLILISFFLLVWYCSNFDYSSKIYYLYRNVSPIFLFYLLFNLKLENINTFNIEKISFFIYCIHLPILKIVRKFLLIILGNNQYLSFIIYFMTIVSTLIICYIIALTLKKFFPKVYILISGNR